jgi:hypothetical protein
MKAAALDDGTATARRLGLLRAVRYHAARIDAVPDDDPRGALDDWLVLHAGAAQFLPGHGPPDALTRARAACAAAELTADERTAVAGVLQGLLLDPDVLGVEPASALEPMVARELAWKGGEAWSLVRRPVSHAGALQWLDTPLEVQRSPTGSIITLRDGSVIVDPR